jgi:hypothetical protein
MRMAVDGQVADPLLVELSSTVIVYCVAQPDQYSNIGSLLSTLEPWVMTSAPGETEYRTPLFVATKPAPVCIGSSISTDKPFCRPTPLS